MTSVVFYLYSFQRMCGSQLQFPVLDEPVGHLATEEDRVARVNELVDHKGVQFGASARFHPVQLTVRAADKAIDRHMDVQLEFSHGLSVMLIPNGH